MRKVEKTLKIEIDEEAFDRVYGHISHPIEIKKKGQKIAVRVISQFGEETTKVLVVGYGLFKMYTTNIKLCVKKQ